MSEKKPTASWMFSKKAKDAAEERERKQREYRLGSDNFTWEEIEEEDDEAEAILDEEAADSRAARPEAAAPVAATPPERPPIRCFDWMFSTEAKNARKRREEKALKRKVEVEVEDDDDSEESNADIQVAILQSIQKEPMEATHVRVQQPEHGLDDKLFEDKAQNVPSKTPVSDGEAALAEELTPEIPDYIIEEDENFQRVIMESLQQQQITHAQYALEQLDQLSPIAGIKLLESVTLSERSNEGKAQSGHENKASPEPEPMETSIDQEQRPDDIDRNNGDAEENAPKNEDPSKPESKDVQLEATVVEKERTCTSLIDERIDEFFEGKRAESDTSASVIGESDMFGSSQESLYVTDTDDEANQEDEDDDKHSKE